MCVSVGREGGGVLCLNRMKRVIFRVLHILQKANISRHNIARGWLIPVKQITVQICMPCQRPGMSSCLDSYLAILFILSQSLTTIVFQSEFGLDSLFSVILCPSHLLPQSSYLPVRRNSASGLASLFETGLPYPATTARAYRSFLLCPSRLWPQDSAC